MIIKKKHVFLAAGAEHATFVENAETRGVDGGSKEGLASCSWLMKM